MTAQNSFTLAVRIWIQLLQLSQYAPTKCWSVFVNNCFLQIKQSAGVKLRRWLIRLSMVPNEENNETKNTAIGNLQRISAIIFKGLILRNIADWLKGSVVIRYLELEISYLSLSPTLSSLNQSAQLKSARISISIICLAPQKAPQGSSLSPYKSKVYAL